MALFNFRCTQNKSLRNDLLVTCFSALRVCIPHYGVFLGLTPSRCAHVKALKRD